MATLGILGICLIVGCVLAFAITIVCWFRNAPNLRAINRTLAADELVVPNGVISSRGAEYVQRFVETASQRTTDNGTNAFARYREPTLKWNDIRFAAAFATFLILGNLAIAATMPLQPYGIWLAFFCALMGLAYGAVKITEDLALVRLVPGTPIAPREARKLDFLGLAKAAFLFLALPAALGWFVATVYKCSPDVLFGVLKLFPILVIVAGLLVPSFGRALWACRVSLISAFGGYLLFLFVIQAQDLFADTTFGNQPLVHITYWTWTFFLAAFIWALPVHYAARDALQNAQRNTPFQIATATWLPRLLGTIPPVVVLIGIFGAKIETRRATTLDQGLDLQYVLLSLGAWITLGALLRYFIIRKRLMSHYLGLNAVRAGRIRIFSLIMSAAIFVILVVTPIWSTQHVAWRAALIPVLFGSAVLVLGRIAVWADRLHRPLLLFIIAIFAVLTAANSRFHEVRLLEDKAPQRATQIPLTEAVKQWRAANDCPEPTDQCPPVLIIAADGGASRAAYFTATVVGELIDRLNKKPSGNAKLADCPGDCAKRADDLKAPDNAKQGRSENPARRIFAMSGVSGGSLGIATIKAALLDSDGVPPCRDDKSSTSWKTCLQNLVEGDYLSPAFVGLGFRDNFAPPIWPFNSVEFWGDRASLLEESWEKYYLRQSKLGTANPTCGEAAPIGLCRHFTQQRPDGAWTPLLLLNGTSVQTGRRIIASEISPIWMKGEGNAAAPQVLHQWAYDLFDIMGAPCVKAGGDDQTCTSNAPLGAAPPKNVRLSTAALLSARFPIVSPWGNIRTADGSHGDSVVDGGYFENSGLTTALDVAAGLYALGLAPIVLSISNDPSPAPASHSDADTSLCYVKPAPPAPAGPADLRLPVGVAGADSVWLRLVGTSYAPAVALLKTRDSHAEEAGRELSEHLQQWDVPPEAARQPCLANQFAPFFPIRVFAKGDTFEMPELSMSWWLSPVVRKALDGQLRNKLNQRQFDLLVDRLAHAGKPNAQK
jgi:hypothetical protein